MADTAAYLATIKHIAAGMGPRQGFQASLRAALRQLARRHPFFRPHLVIFDPETRTLRLCVADAVPRNDDVTYEPGVGVTGQVFVSGRPIIVERLQDHPVFLSKFFARTPQELASLAFLCVPVLAPASGGQGREAPEVIGVLSVDTPCAPLSELQLHRFFLEAVAALIAAQAAHFQDELLRRGHGKMLPTVPGNKIPCSGSRLVAVSKAMRRVVEQAEEAARGREPVLLEGEAGTGKEHIARLIHALGPGNELPLTCFSPPGPETLREECNGFPKMEEGDNAAAREFFGYRKGAFPGAMRTQKGIFELAHQSSLLIEDVDRLSPALQEALARVLRDQEIVRIGGGSPIPVDVRLFCTSTRPLEPLVEAGRFLPDLYARIRARVIALAPLRERREDILPLAQLFLKDISGRSTERCEKRIERLSPPACDLLMKYAWPGNIHELVHVLEQAASLCDGAVLRAVHLPAALQTAGGEREVLSFAQAVEHFERELLCDALQRAHGNMVRAAQELQASYRIVNYKVKKYGIDPRRFATVR